MKYTSKFRLSRLTRKVKNSIITSLKGDVPAFILDDVMNKLDKGEKEIVIPMTSGGKDKSLINYLNEYHKKTNYGWNLPFLHIAFGLLVDRLKMKLAYKDIHIEVFDMSDTDKRVKINYVGKGAMHND